jgi:probable HAF family extracellular repeat protein
MRLTAGISPHPAVFHRWQFRPQLEKLEDRCLLSICDTRDYTIKDLGTFDPPENGEASVALGIYDPNHISGEADSLPGPMPSLRAFRYDGDNMHNLGLILGTEQFSKARQLTVVDGEDHITGFVQHSSSRHEAMYLNGETEDMIGLGTFGGHNSEGSDINSSRIIVGWAQENPVGFGPGDDPPTVAQLDRGFWADGTELPVPTLHEIPRLAGCDLCHGQAYGINDNGIVVGYSQLQIGGPIHAFKYTIGQAVSRDLGTLGGADSRAWEINDNGKVVGQSTTGAAGSPTRGFLHDGIMNDLGALPGHTYAVALDINNSDTVVGFSAESESDIEDGLLQ